MKKAKTGAKSQSSRATCYFDCFSGVSGDMLLGTLVDAGVPVNRLKKELSRLPVKGYKLSARTVKRDYFFTGICFF